MKCHAKGCERDTPDESAVICDACSIELEVLMRHEMAKRLGRKPTDAEFDIFLDRIVAATPPTPEERER